MTDTSSTLDILKTLLLEYKVALLKTHHLKTKSQQSQVAALPTIIG